MSKTKGINHVTVLVKNKKEAEKFYTEILGFTKREIGKSLWIEVGDQFVHISEISGQSVGNTFYHFAIEIENVLDFVKDLISKGVKVFDLDENLNEMLINEELEKPHRQFFIRDVDGNLIELINSGEKYFNPKKEC